MLIETLRLVIVLSAVAAANRFAAPDLIPGVGPEAAALLQTALGAGLGYLLGGVVARRVDRAMSGAQERLAHRHASDILASVLGVLVGAVTASLAAWPVLLLVPEPVVSYPVAATIFLIFVTFAHRLATSKRRELFGVLGVMPSVEGPGGGCLVDSSAAIDGRVLALYKAGLLPQPVCVPSFIVWELQSIADSGDADRRRRGQRGLDVLASLREAGAEVRVIEEDPSATTDQDIKLVVLARRRGMPIVTSDSNLAKAARVQGVEALSLHELAELLRPAIQAGDVLTVEITRLGKEPEQGVGHLEDGTMVVVDGAAEMQGQQVAVDVRSVLQTPNGRMVFAEPRLRSAS